MENQLQIPLDLPDVRIIDVSKLENGWLIRVESSLNGTTCRKCGRGIEHFHGYDGPLRLRHLPLFEVPVWIELRPKRYRCPDCDGGTTTPQLDWYQRRSPNRTAYEQWLLRILINSTVSDVSTTVCSDMDQGYVNAARVALPQAVIVVDRFHVARIYRAGADAVRKREFKRMNGLLPPDIAPPEPWHYI